MREERGMKKKRATKSKAVRTLPSKSLSAKKATGVKGGMRKAGGDPNSTGKPFLAYTFHKGG
jgi:hypothetical protein